MIIFTHKLSKIDPALVLVWRSDENGARKEREALNKRATGGKKCVFESEI